MAILPIKIYGDKILRQKGQPVQAVTDELIIKIKNMLDSMHNANGIGLAANQVGFRESVFVVDLKGAKGYEKFKPIVFINPKIILESEETVVMEEGCLSLPTLHADVERAEAVKIKYLDTDENEKEIDADDYLARVILHEYDHLIAKMIPDRVDYELKKLIQKDLSNIMHREVEIDYPISEG